MNTIPLANSRGSGAARAPIRLTEIPLRIARRCKRWYVESRWKYLGYDFLPVAGDVFLRIYSDARLGHILRYGEFESAERAFLRRFLRSGDTVVDVGANIGLYTLLAGALVGAEGRVFSFEPCSTTFTRLRENVQRNRLRQVSCHLLALSNQTGQAQMSVSCSGDDAWNSLAGALTEGQYATEAVTTARWDDFARGNGVPGRIDFMKIDVEGWECPVLEGAHELLSRTDAPVLQVEFTPDNAVAAGSTCAQLFDQVCQYGYGLYQYDAADSRLAQVFSAPERGHCNLYAIKQLDAALERLAASETRSSRTPA